MINSNGQKSAEAKGARPSTLQQLQAIIGPDGRTIARQTTLKVATGKKPRRQEHVLTPAEREKIERNKLIKEQFQIFSMTYPELVERNTVRYPIPDALILKLPELHGGLMKPKPKPLRVLIEAEEFEQLLYIWEFANNFNEFLDTPGFRIEELRAALSYTPEDDPRTELSLAEEQELPWNEQMELRHLKEKGFQLLNRLHTALVEAFLRDMFPEDGRNGAGPTAVSSSGEKQNQVLAAVSKLIQDKGKLWPEIARLVLTFRRNEDSAAFGPSEEAMGEVLKKLAGMKPGDYISRLTYQEKITLLTVLIDNIHDSNEFRAFLNGRIDAKSVYNKEKMEVYAEIKSLEAQQQELVKAHAESDQAANEEATAKELEDLRVQLAAATRTESRRIKERMAELEGRKNAFRRQQAQLEDQIKKRQAQIGRLHEKTFSAAIKTTMLGQDAAKSEYWHFKDDRGRIYIRTEEEVPVVPARAPAADVVMADADEQEQDVADSPRVGAAGASPRSDGAGGEEDLQIGEEEPALTETKYRWFYYEDEDQVEALLAALNPKGLKERKLQEGLRKITERLKLQKPKKAKAPEPAAAKDLPSAATAEQKPETNRDAPAEEGKEEAKAEEVKKDVEMADTEPVPENAESQARAQEPEDKAAAQTEPKPEEAPEEPPSGVSKQAQEPEESEPSEEVEEIRRVMFETDNWGKCIHSAAWFGQRIPQKRRHVGRGAAAQKDPVVEFFEDLTTLEAALESLLQIDELYTEASAQHEREWEEKSVREDWVKHVKALAACSSVIPLLVQLDDGMSLPTSLLKKPAQNGEGEAKVQRFKLQLFKFWPSTDMKQAWRAYVEQDGSVKDENVNALHIILKILEQVCQQFSIRQAEKMEKKNKQAIQQAVAQPQNAR